MAGPSSVQDAHPSFEEGASSAPSSRCAACQAALAHDQRYCVECGTRRGPLSAEVAELIAAGTTAHGSGGTESPAGHELGGSILAGGLSRFAPSAIGVAVMSTLAFGVVVGAAVSPAQQNVIAKPVLIALAPPAAPSTKAPAASEPPIPEASEPTAATPETSAPAQPGTASAVAAAPAKKPAASASPQSSARPTAPAAALPPVKHVFLVVLSDQGYNAAFGAGSSAPYLSKALPRQGELLPDYYAVSGGELANAIALVSGQGPTPQTATNCPLYADIAPGTTGAEGQVLGDGCVYPQQTLTLADQLTSAGKTWKAYVGGMEGGGPGQPSSCRHPAVGSPDPNQAPGPGDPYVTWRNPFVYFHSLIDGSACTQNDVGLEALAPDLASAGKTPSFAYIVPDACHDGSEEPCAPGQPSGLGPADAFLEKVVPEIERSAAYKEGGLIAITFDQAPQSGPNADSSGCCLSSSYPNLPAVSAPSPATSTTTTPAGPTSSVAAATSAGTAASTTATTSTTTTVTTTSSTTATSTAGSPAGQTGMLAGGGKVGLLLISKYVKPGSVNAIGEYNHFSLLLSIEDLFGLKPLGYAGAPGLLAFDKSVFNA
jgi:phosphatidylinositol-3-phosphatase